MISHVTVRVVTWWVVCSRPGHQLDQLTRFILRLCLRQLGAHFFSDLVTGDAGAGAVEPCFLCRERNQTQRQRNEEEAGLSVCSGSDMSI